MNQPRALSALEAAANVSVGFFVSIIANAVVLPLYGFHVTPMESVSIAVIFTGASVARQYLMRRLFNLL